MYVGESRMIIDNVDLSKAVKVETVVKANGYGSSENDRLLFNKSADGLYYGLTYERFIPVLINAIKELSAKVTALEAG